MTHKEPTIDPEFSKLLPKKPAAELKKLEAKLVAEQQTQDLVGWEETGILVGGHNRYRLFLKHGITPRIDWRSFGPDTPENRQKVADWIVDDQLAGRNLAPKEYDWFLGKKYLRELAKPHKRGSGETARKVAAETGKSEATVRRAARKVKAAEAAERGEAPAPKKKKAGKVKFDHRGFDKAFGVVARGPDDLLDAYPEAPAIAKSRARLLNQQVNTVRTEWEKLVKNVVGS